MSSKKPKDTPEPAADAPAKPAPTSAEVVWREAAALKPHPMFTKIRQPMMAEDGQEWASFVEDVRASGIREPVIINPKNEVMDGRHRAKAAKEAGVPVPCLVRADDEAALIIAGSLAHRRHYTKSGLAYVLHPFAEEYRKAGNRAKSNLPSLKTPENSLKPHEMGFQATRVGATMEIFAQETGVGLELFRQAKQLHEQLDVRDGETVALSDHPEVKNALPIRDAVEYMIFDKGISLGGIFKWFGSLREDAGKNFKKGMAGRNDYVKQISRHFEALPAHWKHWEKVAEERRKVVYNALPNMFAQWPLDVLTRARTTILAVLRDKQAGEAE